MNRPQGANPIVFQWSCSAAVEKELTPTQWKAYDQVADSISQTMSQLYLEHVAAAAAVEDSQRLPEIQRAPDVSQRPAYPAVTNGMTMQEVRSPYKFVRRIENHDMQVHGVAVGRYGPTGEDVIATASWDGTVSLQTPYGSPSYSDGAAVPGPLKHDTQGGLYAVAFANMEGSQNILGCTSADSSASIWDYTTGVLKKRFKHEDEVNGIDFHTRQQVMCTASDDKTVKAWDFQEGMELRELPHPAVVYDVTFLGEEHPFLVATCCFDKISRIFDMRDKSVVAEIKDKHSDDIIGIDYSENVLATGSDDGLICISDSRNWDKTVWEINTREEYPENEVKRVAFSPCGGFLAAACTSKRVLVYDIREKPYIYANLAGHSEVVFDIAWFRQGNKKMLVTASHDKTSRIYIEN